MSESLMVVGLCPEMVTEFGASIGEFPIAGGRMLTAGDEGKAVLGYAVAERSGVTPGETLEIEDQLFEVVGIMQTYAPRGKAPEGHR